MAKKDSHEQLVIATDAAFKVILKKYDSEDMTVDEIEKSVGEYIEKNLEIPEYNNLFVKAFIGDTGYMDISNALDSLIFKTIQEKCCKYNEEHKIFLIVLIIV